MNSEPNKDSPPDLRVRQRVRAFHPRTLGVIYPGTVTKIEGDNVRADFNPMTYASQSSCWCSRQDITEAS